MENKTRYKYLVTIQIVLPADYRSNKSFRMCLEALNLYGFYGVELNIARPTQVDIVDIQSFLGQFQLTFTMFASGLTAKTFNLSLSSPDEACRKASVALCKEMIDLLEGTGVGIIIGFLKGAPGQDRGQDKDCFLDSLGKISPHATEKRVRVLVEATNRYEASVGNSLEEAVSLIKGFKNPYLRILPDTFHMNIEEADILNALRKYHNFYDSVHLSDNNRYFPGLGAIQFADIISTLESSGFKGPLAIEGKIFKSFLGDLKTSIKYLAPMIS